MSNQKEIPMDHFKRAAAALDKAENTNDPMDRDFWLRTSDAWLRLGSQLVGIGVVQPGGVEV